MRTGRLIRLLSLALITVLLLPLAASAQQGRVLNPPLTEYTLPETPEPSDFWNLLLRQDVPPDLETEFVDAPGSDGPYVLESTFNPDNYTLTHMICGFTPDEPLEPVVTLPNGDLFNDPATLSRLGLWPESSALPADAPDGTCVLVVQQIGIGSYLEGEYTVTYYDPVWGEFSHTWTLQSPRFQTVVYNPRGLDFDPERQAEWLLLGFGPEETLRVVVYHRYDTEEPVAETDETGSPLYATGLYELRGETAATTDSFGEAVLVVTVPDALLEAGIRPENLQLIIWSENTGFWGYNVYPVPGVGRIMIGEGRSEVLRQARQADSPELARLEDNSVVEFVTQAVEQFRVRSLSRGLEGWIYDNWVMPLYGVESGGSGS